MNSRFIDHAYIFSTILLTVYSQMIMRWQVGLAGELPADLAGKMYFIGRLLINPWILSGVVATFLSGISWMLAMTKFDVSYAFPFVSLNFLLVLGASAYLLHEPLSTAKIAGTILIVTGVVIIARFA